MFTSTSDLATLTTADFAPYRDLYFAHRADVDHGPQSWHAADWETATRDPRTYASHLVLFRDWLTAENRWLEAAPEGDRRALGEALAAMRRRERDAKADAHQARQDLILARQEAIAAREAAAMPFNAEHPGWRDFWLTAARNATASGHCPEYDRHADLMGGITRDEFRAQGVSLYDREDVTYSVTVTFTYRDTVNTGDDSWVVNASAQELAELAYSRRYELDDATAEEQDREEYQG